MDLLNFYFFNLNFDKINQEIVYNDCMNHIYNLSFNINVHLHFHFSTDLKMLGVFIFLVFKNKFYLFKYNL